MEATFMLDALPSRDYQAALEIINQLGKCRTREELNEILKTSLLPLMSCNGVFYARLEGECNTPQLLDSINLSELCRCWWETFYSVATQSHLQDGLPVDDKVSLLTTKTFCSIGQVCSKCSTYPSNTNPNIFAFKS